MSCPEDKEPKEHTDRNEKEYLALDGSANLDYSDDNTPRVKGLIELLNQYFGAKQR